MAVPTGIMLWKVPVGFSVFLFSSYPATLASSVFAGGSCFLELLMVSCSWFPFCTPVFGTGQLKPCRFFLCARSYRQIPVWCLPFFQHDDWAWAKKDPGIISLEHFWLVVVTRLPVTVSPFRVESKVKLYPNFLKYISTRLYFPSYWENCPNVKHSGNPGLKIKYYEIYCVKAAWLT